MIKRKTLFIFYLLLIFTFSFSAAFQIFDIELKGSIPQNESSIYVHNEKGLVNLSFNFTQEVSNINYSFHNNNWIEPIWEDLTNKEYSNITINVSKNYGIQNLIFNASNGTLNSVFSLQYNFIEHLKLSNWDISNINSDKVNITLNFTNNASTHPLTSFNYSFHNQKFIYDETNLSEISNDNKTVNLNLTDLFFESGKDVISFNVSDNNFTYKHTIDLKNNNHKNITKPDLNLTETSLKWGDTHNSIKKGETIFPINFTFNLPIKDFNYTFNNTKYVDNFSFLDGTNKSINIILKNIEILKDFNFSISVLDKYGKVNSNFSKNGTLQFESGFVLLNKNEIIKLNNTHKNNVNSDRIKSLNLKFSESVKTFNYTFNNTNYFYNEDNLSDIFVEDNTNKTAIITLNVEDDKTYNLNFSAFNGKDYVNLTLSNFSFLYTAPPSNNDDTGDKDGGGGSGSPSNSQRETPSSESLTPSSSLPSPSKKEGKKVTSFSNDFGYSISVDNSIDLTNSFDGRKNIKLQNKQSLSYDIEFYHNFNLQDLDLSNVKVVKENTQENNYILIKNLKLQEGETKKVKLPKMKNTNLICIKDLSLNSIDELSDNCDNENEFVIECNNKKVEGGYKCSIENNHYVIFNLKHSAIKEIEKTENIPPPLVPLTGMTKFTNFLKDAFFNGKNFASSYYFKGKDLFMKYIPRSSPIVFPILSSSLGAIVLITLVILITHIHSKKRMEKITKRKKENLSLIKELHKDTNQIQNINSNELKTPSQFQNSIFKTPSSQNNIYGNNLKTPQFQGNVLKNPNLNNLQSKNNVLKTTNIQTNNNIMKPKSLTDLEKIKEYIEKYKSKYPKEKIMESLSKMGKFNIKDLSKVYKEEFFNKNNSNSQEIKEKPKLTQPHLNKIRKSIENKIDNLIKQ